MTAKTIQLAAARVASDFNRAFEALTNLPPGTSAKDVEGVPVCEHCEGDGCEECSGLGVESTRPRRNGYTGYAARFMSNGGGR